ncbi:M15 family metallopeptidase [Leekyejoonella antrihumi]|uniref:D-alanyl-D-alanine carboxypeptidase-like core domain-containing protein n=1 Tax=Leekyejoonella antrihumi TaxID=1660198 RepID=A0A563DR70_9MICO|nr:M15 family metallopeptidase [Leekyejoonella antrihumi]TWP32715.1 hypothetical protein FGL98_23485 [Leekyejoonella antrihumi]
MIPVRFAVPAWVALVVLGVGMVSGPAAIAAPSIGQHPAQSTTTVRFAPLTPSRVLDTRLGVGAAKAQAAAGSTTKLQVTGRGGVPDAGVAAVVLNVTVVDPSGPGYVTVYPAGARRPTASNVNYVKSQVIANQVIAKISADGAVDVYTRQATQLVVDVTGYYLTGAAYGPLTPSRMLDTRTGLEPQAGSTTRLQVTGRGGVPKTGVAAVVLNVTAVDPSGPGFIAVYPAGASRPTTSNLNYATGQVVAGMTIVKVGVSGQVDLYTPASTNILVDIAGWIPTGSDYTPLLPARILDTRNGTGQPQVKVPAGGSVSIQVTGHAGIPTSGVSAVEVDVVAVNASDPGFVTTYPAEANRPTASVLNYAGGQAIANSATVKLSATGQLTLFTRSGADLIVDVVGYWETPVPNTISGWVASTDHQVNVRSGPGFDYGITGHLDPGEHVDGTLASGSWAKVNGGYLNVGTLESISSNLRSINGKLNASSLCMISVAYNSPDSFDPGYTQLTPRYLNCPAVVAMDELQTAYKEKFNHYAYIDLSYRSYAEQEYWYNKYGYPRAAIPGTSNHGLAEAVDFREYTGSTEFDWGGYGNTWLEANALTYGFANPFRYGTSGESYHFNFVG